MTDPRGIKRRVMEHLREKLAQAQAEFYDAEKTVAKLRDEIGRVGWMSPDEVAKEFGEEPKP